MLLYNENLQQLNPEVLLAELAELADVTVPGKDGLERLLSDYYHLAQRIDGGQYGVIGSEKTTAFAGSLIWQKIRDFGCPRLAPDSSITEIAGVVLQAVASIIPGGVVNVQRVRSLIKYIMHNGLGAFCNYKPDAVAVNSAQVQYMQGIKQRLYAHN